MGVTKEQAKASQQAAFKKEAAAQASGQTTGGSPVGETSAQKAARESTTGGKTEAQKQAELHGQNCKENITGRLWNHNELLQDRK